MPAILNDDAVARFAMTDKTRDEIRLIATALDEIEKLLVRANKQVEELTCASRDYLQYPTSANRDRLAKAIEAMGVQQ